MVARGLAILLGCSLVMGGCIAHPPPQKQLYTGPTEPMSQVVNAINANNSRVPTLWARGYFEANVVDQGKTHFVNGDINVVYRTPADLRLVAKKDVAGTIFEVGSNATDYWFTAKGDVDTMWRGRHDAIRELNPPRQIPIQPELMLDVLGVNTIDLDFKRPPVPVMRFNDYADAYMFVWSAPVPDRWVATKEVWYDRASKLPTKIALFDANGRPVLQATLANHKPVSDQAGAPKVATSYKLYFADSRTTMSFDLSDVALQHGEGARAVPNDRSFAFPTPPGVAHVIDVDEDRNPTTQQ